MPRCPGRVRCPVPELARRLPELILFTQEPGRAQPFRSTPNLSPVGSCEGVSSKDTWKYIFSRSRVGGTLELYLTRRTTTLTLPAASRRPSWKRRLHLAEERRGPMVTLSACLVFGNDPGIQTVTDKGISSYSSI